jgi:lipopolysaccharide/colanic/teichoic acid biosynthesis glycosyltransferase
MQRPGPTYRAAKRAIDVVGALAGLVLLSVPMAIIALAIKLSDPRSPVLFRQWRCGQGARRFRLAKFRTMVPGADALKDGLRDSSVSGWPDFRVFDDPRVTRLGRMLRSTSLDELPQLWSVLRGDMSLVGPRPTSFDADTYTLWQTERLEHRPGLTGPWQVRGRTDMDFDERCRLEISFFRLTSLGRELWLILSTVGVVLRRTGTR